MDWHRLAVGGAAELDLRLTLASGQAFRWRETGGNEWTGAIGQKLYTLRQSGATGLEYRVHNSSEPTNESEALVRYLRLDFDLSALYAKWSQSDANFREKAAQCSGVRLLWQDALETLITFICSSNNNIQRISQMMTKLSHRYGDHLGCYQGNEYHAFPRLERLSAEKCESELREMGFGYRARYVHGTARMVEEKLGGGQWLETLKSKPYQEAWQELQQLPGVGAKVADCVCLMGLGHMTAVPVDVHVWRLAQRDYGVADGGRSKTLSPHTYRLVGERFVSVFGAEAGWAQAVLFTAEIQRTKSKGCDDKSVRKKSLPSSAPASKRAKVSVT